MKTKRILYILATLAPIAANAADIMTCSQDKATLAKSCFIDSSVRDNGSLRAAELAIGPPGAIERKGHLVVVDCTKEKLASSMVLRDGKGLNYAGGFAGDLPSHSRILANALCEAKPLKHDPKLIMFAK